MRLLLISAALAAAVALPAFADDAPAPTAPTATVSTATVAAPAAKKDDGVICKMKAVTGSRFGTKVCTTKEQRDAEAAQARDMLAARAMADKPPGS